MYMVVSGGCLSQDGTWSFGFSVGGFSLVSKQLLPHLSSTTLRIYIGALHVCDCCMPVGVASDAAAIPVCLDPCLCRSSGDSTQAQLPFLHCNSRVIIGGCAAC